MKDQKVKPQDTVVVTATGLAQYMTPGKEYTLHRLAAEKLLLKGVVK